MAKQNKVVNVLSTAALAGLVTSAMLSSQAFAKVDAYTVKVGEDVFKYDKAELVASFLDNSEGIEAPLYQDFTSKVSEGKGVYAFHDDKNGFVSFGSVADAFASAEGQDFDMNAFTESDKAEVVTVSAVKKAVVVDGEVKYNDEGEVTGDLAVESVTAINAAQIKVTFNKVLTGDAKDEATDLDNYTLENTKGDEVDDIFKAVDVEEGSKEAILTVDFTQIGEDDDEYQNQASYKLILDKNITGEEASKEFKVSDFDIPEVESVEVAGIRTIKVVLSEPVVAKDRTNGLYEDLTDSFEVNEGSYSIEKVEAINNGKELNIVLYSDLKDGTELTVDVKSEAEDYAGYALKKGSYKVTADVNKEDLAIVEYTKAKDDEITLVFNKDIKFVDYEDDTKLVKSSAVSSYDSDFKAVSDSSDVFESFYHTTSKNEVEAVEIDGNEVTLHFASDDLLPETAYVFVDADVLQDLWEKKNDALNIKVAVNKDSVKPEVKEVKQDDDSNRKIVVTFTEELDKESAEKESNYTVKDKDGKDVRVSNAELTDDDEVTLTVSKDLEDGDKYKVTLEDVEDKAGNKIADITKEFTAKETQAVSSIDAKYYDKSSSSQKIVVDFGTQMLADGSRYAINNLDNYDLTIVYNQGQANEETYPINLSDYDDASIKAVEDDHKVEIKLPGNTPDKDDRFDFTGTNLTLKVNKVDDSNENRSAIMTATVNAKATDIGLDEDAVATDRETIKVVFEEELKFEDNDITLKYGTVDGSGVFTELNADAKITPASKKVEKKDGLTTVTYELKEADQLTYDGKFEKDGVKYVVAVTTVATPESENSYGDTLAGNQKWVIVDEIAPEIAKLAETNGGDSTTGVALDIVIEDRDDYEDAVMVTSYDSGNKTATVVLVLQEDIAPDNISKFIFKTDDDDVEVTDAIPVSGEANVIKLTLDASASTDGYTSIDDFVGLGISTGSNEVFDKATDANSAIIDTEVEIKNTDAAAAWK